MFNFRKYILFLFAFMSCPINSYKTIVITGGPCAGKTTSLPIISDLLGKTTINGKKIEVLLLNEIATLLINQNLTKDKLPDGAKEFQKLIFEKQIETEKELIGKAMELEREHPNTECVIICDRGLADGLAYMSDDQQTNILKEHKLELKDIYDRYDLVIHLQSFAHDNNLYEKRRQNRQENSVQAKKLDETLKKLWSKHTKFTQIISKDKDVKNRASEICDKITQFLSEKDFRQ